jgi:acyl-coenzyme A synthetase/AMP-(fatty) acid ligase
MLRLVNQSGITVWQSVPSALTLQTVSIRQQPDPMHAVRCVLFAGERMPRQTLLRLPEVFPNARFYNIYGCTETNNSFMYLLPQDVAQAPDPLPIGKPLPHIRYRIVDESGRDVGPGQEGQLLVSGETVMAGYLVLQPNDSAGEAPYAPEDSKDGFYRTKDIVSIGEDGNLRFHGRLDAVIKTNGYRVNLMEIEDHLRRSEKLEEVALLCAPDDLIGNRIIAIVRPRAGELCSTLDLKLYCAGALPKYAIPHCFHITNEELPKGDTGKVDKCLLAQIWRQASAKKPTLEGDTNHEFA